MRGKKIRKVEETRQKNVETKLLCFLCRLLILRSEGQKDS